MSAEQTEMSEYYRYREHYRKLDNIDDRNYWKELYPELELKYPGLYAGLDEELGVKLEANPVFAEIEKLFYEEMHLLNALSSKTFFSPPMTPERVRIGNIAYLAERWWPMTDPTYECVPSYYSEDVKALAEGPGSITPNALLKCLREFIQKNLEKVKDSPRQQTIECMTKGIEIIDRALNEPAVKFKP